MESKYSVSRKIFGTYNLFLFFPKFATFFKFSKKIMFYHFYWCLASAISMVQSNLIIFDKCNTYYPGGTLTQNYIINRKFKWQKSPVGGSTHIFIKFSVCKSLKMKKDQIFFQKYQKIIFHEFSFFFLKICWSDLVGTIGFFEADDMDYLLVVSRKHFKGPLNAQNIFKF